VTINRATKFVSKAGKSVDAFIDRVPDSGRKGVIRGRKEQTTLTITPELLAKVDEMARRMGAVSSGTDQPGDLRTWGTLGLTQEMNAMSAVINPLSLRVAK
jgi:hypothetical protein